MTTRTKHALLATVAYAAFAPQGALAFDEVNWSWNKEVTEVVTKNVNVTIESTPTGMVELEKVQTQIGDVTADSTVSGIHNNPPAGGEGGVIVIDETFTVSASYGDPNGVGNTENSIGGTIIPGDGNQLTGTFLGGQLSEQANGFNDIMDIHLSGEFQAEDLDGVNQAVDLPEVVSAATAVGNNQSIDSTVSMELHDAQFLWGGFADAGTANGTGSLDDVLSVTPDGGNTYTDAAAFLTFSGALGLITPASVSANSSVSDITNASVDSNATAVGNNMDLTLAAISPDDALVIGDITQFAYADVSATSSVSAVEVSNYAGFGDAGMGPLGDPQHPLVNSVATAVGNNFSLSVSSPAL